MWFLAGWHQTLAAFLVEDLSGAVLDGAGDWLASVEPESSDTWPARSSFPGHAWVSDTDNTIGLTRDESVFFQGTDYGGSSETRTGSYLVDRFRDDWFC